MAEVEKGDEDPNNEEAMLDLDDERDWEAVFWRSEKDDDADVEVEVDVDNEDAMKGVFAALRNEDPENFVEADVKPEKIRDAPCLIFCCFNWMFIRYKKY